jgi:hypothetical protein
MGDRTHVHLAYTDPRRPSIEASEKRRISKYGDMEIQCQATWLSATHRCYLTRSNMVIVGTEVLTHGMKSITINDRVWWQPEVAFTEIQDPEPAGAAAGRRTAFQAKVSVLKNYKSSLEVSYDNQWSRMGVPADDTYIWGIRDCPRCRSTYVRGQLGCSYCQVRFAIRPTEERERGPQS